MQYRYVLPAALAAVALFVGSAHTSAAEFAYLSPPGASADVFPRPDRPVAKVISPGFSSEAMRDVFKEALQIAQLMSLKPGMTLADIGAGNGYHTVRLAPLLGPSGRLIAQDISADYLATLAKRLKFLKLD